MTSATEEKTPGLEVSPETEKEYARLTDAQWAEAESLYETGMLNGAQICEKFGIKTSTWKMRLYRAKDKGKPIVKGSKIPKVKEEISKAAVEGTISAATRFAREKRERIDKYKESSFITASVFDSTVKRILKDISAPAVVGVAATRPADKHPDIKSMMHLGKTLRENYRWIMENILEAGKEIDEKELPKLSFRDLSEEDLEIIRRGNDEDDLDGLPEMELEEEEIVEVAPPEETK